jgi:hypothetical protein
MEEPPRKYPAELVKMWDAHGGLDTWKKMSLLTYHFASGEKKEIHFIDLNNRKVLINGDGYDIGFDGENAWISPDKSNYPNARPRFVHNLYFYFHSLVFLVADPGTNYNVKGLKKIDEKDFLEISITYGENVGDSPEDEYILLLNPDTHKLEQILYTVTYYSKEKSKKYSGLKYTAWKDVNGLLLPTEMKGYTYEEGKFGKERYTAKFSDLTLLAEAPDQEIFEVPDIAVIDTLQ